MLQIVNETKDHVAVFKPNFAYFEALGPSGMEVLQELIQKIPPEIPVIGDAGEMLGQFGLSFRDPLEIFVDWARQIFQEVTESFEDNADYRTSTESSNHKTQTKSYTDKDPLDNIEAELGRLKKQQVKATSKSAFSVRSNIKDTDIEQELRSIKKKYKL